MQQIAAKHPNIVNQITSLMQHGYIEWAHMQAMYADSEHPDRPTLQVCHMQYTHIYIVRATLLRFFFAGIVLLVYCAF